MRTAVIAMSLLSFSLFQMTSAAESSADVLVPYKVLQIITLGGDGGWDYLTVDAPSRRLYIGRSTRAMVVDLESGKLVGEIVGNGVHGVAIAPTAKHGFVSNGKDDTVTIFNTETLAVIGKVPAGKKPDAIIYDPTSDHVYVSDNGGTTVTVLAPTDGATLGTIEVGGAPEFAVTDGKGHVYVNIEDKNEIVVIDAATMKATAHWALAGKTPTGLSMDREHRRLFSGCRGTKTLEVLDADSGKTVASLPIGAGVDATVFDPSTGNVFSSNGDGTLTIVHEDTPDTFRVVQTLPTKSGARTMGFDEQTHHVMTASVERQSGTFTAMVIGH